MSTPPQIPSKRFAQMLALAIDARCLTYRDYIPWADEILTHLENAPFWICELSLTKYHPDALGIIYDFLRSEPFEEFNTVAEDFLGFLWVRYERGELSWATFLNEAGQHSDSANGPIECEYFYSLLNELEETKFDSKVESRQREAVRQRLGDAIGRAHVFYEEFSKRD